jgi:hypothetical protein
MRALSIATVFFGVPWVAGYAAVPPPIEIPVTITQGTSVRVPFSVPRSGTYDLMLQYRARVETYDNRILNLKLRRELAGTATLSSDGKTLKHKLPTGWGSSFSGRVATVIVRFRAQAQKTYVCSLRITHLPSGVPHKALLGLIYVTPNFHPGNHVYELQ